MFVPRIIAGRSSTSSRHMHFWKRSPLRVTRESSSPLETPPPAMLWRQLRAIFLVRNELARSALRRAGADHVIVTKDGFADTLRILSAELETTAVFDGVGGDLLGQMAPNLPMNSTIYIYGLLGAANAVSVNSTLFLTKNLIMRRFSNFESRTVKEHEALISGLRALEDVIDDPLFTTGLGKEFRYHEIG